MVTKLQLDKFDDNNPKTFRLVDGSEYNPKIVVENAVLSITPPGFSDPTNIKVKPEFNLALNASLLNIAKVKSRSQLADLPDGIYNIVYSIKPNTELYVEYDYMRVIKLMSKFHKVVATILSRKKEYSNRDFYDKKIELLWIRELIEASVYEAEELNDPDKSKELYAEANLVLDRYVNTICHPNININDSTRKSW